MSSHGGGSSGASRVKNRAPAEIQLTVDHLLHEAQEFRHEPFEPTRTKIANEDELAAYRGGKRKEFETALHHNRHNFGAWIKYAKWEADQKEFDRARSVFERALEMDPANTGVWQKYALMEMQHGFVNSARNIWTRATQTVPRFDPFWFKWQGMEERLGNVDGARAVLEAWMRWRPAPDAWNLYVNFELRHRNPAGARRVYESYLACHDALETYLRYARFESEFGDPARARAVYDRARIELGDEEVLADARYHLAYAAFEESQRNYDRCRALYREALDVLPRAWTEKVLARYTAFEKQRGATAGIEDVVLSKKRLDYEAELAATPMAYDAWFEYLRLEEHYAGMQLDAAAAMYRLQHPEEVARFAEAALADAVAEERDAAEGPDAATAAATSQQQQADAEEGEGTGSVQVGAVGSARVGGVPLSALPEAQRDGIHARVRELYARAQQQEPPTRTDKEAWRRYVYLWINHAVYEELIAEAPDRARAVYKQLLARIPHGAFTFSQVWILAAELEVRGGRIDAMRKLLGFAIGRCPRPRVFDAYIALESDLGEVARCRTLYQKYLECFPLRASTWAQFAQLEADLAEAVRARDIFEIALQQGATDASAAAAVGHTGTGVGLDEPAALWTAYLAFQRDQGDAAATRALYARYTAAAAAADRVLSARGGPIAPAPSVARAGQLVLLTAWLEAAAFELEAAPGAAGIAAARAVYERADAVMKDRVRAAVTAAGGGGSGAAGGSLLAASGGAGASASEEQINTMVAAKEDRVRLLEAWRAFEATTAGDAAAAAALATQRMPERVKRTRRIVTEGGAEAGMHEYQDYIFPDLSGAEGGASGGGSKLLSMAQKWKKMKLAAEESRTAAE